MFTLLDYMIIFFYPTLFYIFLAFNCNKYFLRKPSMSSYTMWKSLFDFLVLRFFSNIFASAKFLNVISVQKQNNAMLGAVDYSFLLFFNSSSWSNEQSVSKKRETYPRMRRNCTISSFFSNLI